MRVFLYLFRGFPEMMPNCKNSKPKVGNDPKMIRPMKSGIITIFLFIVGTTVLANAPEELGKVKWLREMKIAQDLSASTQKPILILFQEIPGCSTCKKYGNQVLSHPLIAEAIESLFIPMAVYNNKSGKDAEWLAYFKEPSWNNPVVRIVDANKKDILPRLNGNYSPGGLVAYMMRALYLQGSDIPTYLTLIRDELQATAQEVEKATLSMYCFWTGEKEFGSLDGVVHTEAGFMDNREVVNVYYDPKVVSLSTLIESGKKVQCADQLYATNNHQKNTGKFVLGDRRVKEITRFTPDREPKYYLSKTAYRYLPMSQIQAVKANALVGAQKNPEHLFSPKQVALLKMIRENPKNNWKPMIQDPAWQDAWWEISRKIKT